MTQSCIYGKKSQLYLLSFLYVGKILMCTLMRDIDWSVFSGIFFACFWCQNNTDLIKWVLKFYSGQEFCGGKVFIKNSTYLLNMEIFRFSISFKASYGHCFFSQGICSFLLCYQCHWHTIIHNILFSHQ